MKRSRSWLPVVPVQRLWRWSRHVGGEDAPAGPSSGQARGLLVEMVALANPVEWERLCSMAGSSQPEPSCPFAVEALGSSSPYFQVDVLDERVYPARTNTRPSRVLHVCIYIDREPAETEVSFVVGPGGRNDVPWPWFWEQRWYTSDTIGVIAPKPMPRPGEETPSPYQPL